MPELTTPILVNFCGQPGAGKSTMAATVFSKLKMLGVNCELVTEFAKDKVWEQNDTALANQVYIFAKQYYRLSRCEDKVDVIITDSPLCLTPLYSREEPAIDKPLRELAMAIFNKYNNLNYLVRRVKKYNPVGRLQTEAESDEKGVVLRKLLDNYKVPYKEVDGKLESTDGIIEDIMNRIAERKCA